MHFSKYIFFVFSSCFTALSAFGHIDSKIDSIYQHLSKVDRISKLVWVQSSGEEELSHDIYNFGGVYFDQPLEMPPLFDGTAVAVQVDEKINPLPLQMTSLPDLMTLASITQADILSTYFYFLKSNCKAYGIDYVILPQVSEKEVAQQNVLDKMVAFDPAFFKRKNDLSFEETKRKKDLQRIFTSNDYWVVSSEFLEIASKSLKKYVNRFGLSELESHVKNALLNFNNSRDYEIRKLPNQLAVAISRASVIPLQKGNDLLPISRDTICLITDQPYGLMSNMLRKYAYVITSYPDISQSNAPIIIDNNSYVPEDLITENRIVVFVGSLKDSRQWVSRMDAALIYTQYSEIYDYTLPQQIFGSTNASGRLPIREQTFALFKNEAIDGKDILGYAPPEMTGLDFIARDEIEAIVGEAIQSGSTPGCQLAIALDGSIIFDEAYGYLTYDSLLPVDRSTIYDLASVTKVTATLLAIMKLYESDKIDLDKTLGDYLEEYANSNKKDLTIRSILAHHSGLKSYVPFWKRALNSERIEAFYYESEEDENTDTRSYGLKPDPILLDSLRNWIVASPLVNTDREPFYNYSDIGFMILHQVVERVSGKPMDQYLEDEFYHKMQLEQLTFNPRNKGFELFEIAPTEYDYYFRNELVWGEVHDRNAAVFGGVSGHAGLFSNAHDLLIILQTMLQKGKYGGITFLKQETIDYFNKQYFPHNRRALGWDKKDSRFKNASRYASEASFGHTGFTGTIVWVDPTFDLIFVFLSNRIYPNANNYQLNRRNIRTRIQDVVYEAILTKWLN